MSPRFRQLLLGLRSCTSSQDDKVWAAGQQLHSQNYSYSTTLAQKTPRETEAFVLRWDLALVPVMLEVAVGASSDGAQLWEKKLQHQEGKQEHIVLCVVSVEVWPKCFWFSLILLICVSTYKLFSVLNQKKSCLFFTFFSRHHIFTPEVRPVKDLLEEYLSVI